MLQIIMLVALGFLAAMLFALMLAPLLWRRAVRLTTRRIQGTTPLSMSDIQADKDQLRAEFAMSTRKLEMAVESLKDRANNQLIEISSATDRAEQMAAAAQEKSDLVVALENTINDMKEQMLSASDEVGEHLQARKDATVAYHQAQEEAAEMTQALADARMKIDEQKVELAALKTQLANQEQVAQEITTESSSAIEARKSAEAEAKQLRKEVEDLRRQAQAGWDDERMENALLRERLNDVAAEVANLTLQLDGASPEVRKILEEEAPATNGAKRKKTRKRASGESKSLADRIRALQAQASRA